MSARKDIRNALYDLLGQAIEFKSTGKGLTVPQNVEAYDMPALFIVKPEEAQIESQVYGLQKNEQHLHAVIYLKKDATPADVSIEDVIDDLLDTILGQPNTLTGIFNTKNPDGTPKLPGEAQTLGGLVTDTRVSGTIFIDSGAIGTLCAIEIPFAVVCGI